MPNHSVSVSQLVSPFYGKGRYAFLNVFENIYGGIGVWTNTYGCLTYLLRRDNDIYFMQFIDEECADEWLKDNCKESDGWKVIKL